MRLSLLHVVLGLGCVFVVSGAACGGDSSSGDNGSSGDGGPGGGGGDDTGLGGGGGDDGTTGGGDDSGIDANTLPLGQGDPCRGTAIPSAQVYVPQGMCAVQIGQVNGARQISFAPNGDLFATGNDGTVHLLHDDNGDGIYQSAEVHTWTTTGGAGNNVHVDAAGGYVYGGAPDRVKRWAYTAGAMTAGTEQDVVVNIPSGGNHPLHTVHVWDGYLYVHSGSSGNASDGMSPAYDTSRSLLKRFALSSFTGTALDWSAGEVVTVGLRNMVGYGRNAAGRMFGVVNGLDDVHYANTDVHQDNPGEQVLELGTGKQYGYPFCFTAATVPGFAPGTQLFNQDFGVHDDAWCATNSMQPATFLQAHSAPLDITFFETQPRGALPDKWRGGAFITSHGSWDRTKDTGRKVVWMPFTNAGAPPMPTASGAGVVFPYEVVFGGGNASGPVDGQWSWISGSVGETPRPVGVAVGPIDGALYISSDQGGMLYRVGVHP